MTQKSDNCSEETARVIDEEVRRIVNEQYERSVQMLTAHLAELEKVGEALLVHETLSGLDIKVLMDGGTIDRKLPEEAKEESDAQEGEAQEGEKKRASLFPPIQPDKDPEPA